MAYADPERQRAYQREWVAERRANWLSDKCCVDCGATDRLELDHIDPDQKADHRIWSWSWKRIEEEVAKCVVRCAPCHRARHAAEARRHGIGLYGRGCRCDECRAAKAASNRKYYKSRRRRESNARPRLCRPVHDHSATAPEHADGTRVSLVMVDRRDRPEHEPEAEPVLVVVSASAVEFVCDDGLSLTFPRDALTDAVAQEDHRG